MKFVVYKLSVMVYHCLHTTALLSLSDLFTLFADVSSLVPAEMN